MPSTDMIAKTLQLSATRMRAFAVGAMACGATAIGALAVGTLAVGRLTVRQSEFAKVEIGDFVVRCLTAMEFGPDSANAALAAHVAPAAAANASTRR